MTSESGTRRPRPSLSMMLVLAIVLLTVIRLTGAQSPWPHWLPRPIAYAYGWAHILANFVLAATGLRTPQRTAWAIYLAVSVLALVAFGSTPLVALWLLPGVLNSILH